MAGVVEITDDNFDAEVLKAKEPVLVDFWAPWCGPCRMMHPILESLAQKYDGKALIARCNVDESRATAAKFAITAIPTMILFKDGSEIDKMIGVTPEPELAFLLDSYS